MTKFKECIFLKENLTVSLTKTKKIKRPIIPYEMVISIY